MPIFHFLKWLEAVQDKKVEVLDKMLVVIGKMQENLAIAVEDVDLVRVDRVFGPKLLRVNRTRDV